MTQKQINQKETGRSMTEMLGVLAVIGVLSAGGIMGYKSANDKSKANEIVYGISQRVTILSQKTMVGDEITASSLNADFGENDKLAGFEYTLAPYSSKEGYGIVVKGLTKGVCEKALEAGLKNAAVIKLGTTTVWENGEKSENSYTCTDNSTVAFEFNNELDAGSDSGKGAVDMDESECGNTAGYKWCDLFDECIASSDSCACPTGTSGSGLGGAHPDYSACKCPSYQTWNGSGCGCQYGTCTNSYYVDGCKNSTGDCEVCLPENKIQGTGTVVCNTYTGEWQCADWDGSKLCLDGRCMEYCECDSTTKPTNGDSWSCNVYTGAWFCDSPSAGNTVCESGPDEGNCVLQCRCDPDTKPEKDDGANLYCNNYANPTWVCETENGNNGLCTQGPDKGKCYLYCGCDESKKLSGTDSYIFCAREGYWSCTGETCASGTTYAGQCRAWGDCD